ncbi:MAG: hypothetical protein AB8H47_19880 [Bacteroidia bacterium]
MKVLNISLCLVFMLGIMQLQAQRPEKVVRITKELHETDWYRQQAISWKTYLETQPEDAAAWQSYYEANRALRNLTGEPLEDLDQIIKTMKQHVPMSFEYSYLVYRQGGISTDGNQARFEFLEKAHEIAPSRTEVLEEFVTHYELAWDPAKRLAFNVKRLHANDISYEVLSYNYNVLMSLEPNAILFTNGDNDTYPLWLLQDAMGVRQDVIVLNCSLAMENAYLNRLLKHYGIAAFEKEIDTQTAFARYHADLRTHLLALGERPLYYALTVNSKNYESVKDKLYVVGLASKYSEKRFDNSSVLAQNVEEKFRLEYMLLDLAYYTPQSPAGQFAQAYLMPLLSLHRYYKSEGESEKATELKKMILSIARKAEREAEIKEILD